jgi:membrane-bound serine protease (ClpP class)
MKRFGILLIFLAALLAAFQPAHAQSGKPLALVMTADGPIEPAMEEYFSRGIATAEQRKAEVLIIQLNTPGGDISTMLDIVAAIRSSTVPVVIYVAPRGALAASAGSLITMAGQASAMAPETTIGASIPIDSSGQNLASDLRTKQINTLKEKINPFVEPRGKPALQLAYSMIEEGASADVTKALDAKLVDFPANDVNDLLNKLNGFTVQMAAGPRTLHTANAQTEPLDISLIEQFLLFITDSNIVFILLSMGILALQIELSHPGAWIPGFVGVVCLSLAFYGIGLLHTQPFGFVFIVTAFILFILDIKAPTHGALTAAGVGAFIVGALVLFNTPSTPQFQRVSVPLVVGVGVFIGLMFFGILLFALRTMNSPVLTGTGSFIGKTGTAKVWDEAGGQVQVESELWSAEPASESEKIGKGDKVEVVQVEGLHLKVRKIK